MNYLNPFVHGTLLIKEKIIKELGGYDERFYYAQDYKLFKDLLNKNHKYTPIRAIKNAPSRRVTI